MAARVCRRLASARQSPPRRSRPRPAPPSVVLPETPGGGSLGVGSPAHSRLKRPGRRIALSASAPLCATRGWNPSGLTCGPASDLVGARGPSAKGTSCSCSRSCQTGLTGHVSTSATPSRGLVAPTLSLYEPTAADMRRNGSGPSELLRSSQSSSHCSDGLGKGKFRPQWPSAHSSPVGLSDARPGDPTHCTRRGEVVRERLVCEGVSDSSIAGLDQATLPGLRARTAHPGSVAGYIPVMPSAMGGPTTAAAPDRRAGS